MSRSQLIRFSGWAFILGAFSFVTMITALDAIAIPGSLISGILLAVGMLGLRLRYGEQAGGVGRNILLAGAIGTVLPAAMLAWMVLIYSGGPRPRVDALFNEGWWILLFGGPVLLLLALALFGLATLRNKAMARLSWLAVLAGIWYPVWYFLLTGYLFTHHPYPARDQAAFNAIFLVQFVALCVFGNAVATDASRETAAA